MLALPVTNAASGFADSSLFLFFCWLTMTVGALLILEVNLWLPPGSNMVSMAQKTLGRPGKVTAWLSYLFLLYALLAAYIAGGSDVFQSILMLAHIHLPSALSAVLFVLIFGSIVYMGIKSVDYVNRGLMFGKLGIYILLVLLIAPHIQPHLLKNGHMKYVTGTLMVLVTSFGFATIVPSLRQYFEDDVQKLRKVIVYGSLIPLFCYIAWDAVIMGVVPADGQNGLLALMLSDHATSGLTTALSQVTQSTLALEFFRVFTSICMLTAFLGVSLCLTDFLADGLKMTKTGKQGVLVTSLCLIPPLIIVLFYPGAFIQALKYAGIFCVILLLMLPALMAWRGRYHKNFDSAGYRVRGGKLTLSLVLIASCLLLVLACTQTITMH